MKEYQISVAICTYNRPEMLRCALETLACQETDGKIKWEILIIDNDPDCSAKHIFEKAVSTSPIPLQYIEERNAGLSYARNRAIVESRGEIIAFLDDDTLVPRTWLMEMLGTFERTGADCVGGRVLVGWEGCPDENLKECERELVAFDKGDQDFRIVGRKVSPIGANLAFRANLFSNGVRFPTNLGRLRTNLMGCEEVKLLLRLKEQGRSIWYSANSMVTHRTGGERLTEGYYIRREYWNGVSLAIVDRSQKKQSYCFLKAWIRIMQVCFALAPCWLFSRIMGNRRRRLLNTCYILKYFGYWKSMMGLARKTE